MRLRIQKQLGKLNGPLSSSLPPFLPLDFLLTFAPVFVNDARQTRRGLHGFYLHAGRGHGTRTVQARDRTAYEGFAAVRLDPSHYARRRDAKETCQGGTYC